MKKLLFTLLVATVFVTAACGPRRSPGRAYVPDMAYSKAYETYADVNGRLANSAAAGAHFDGHPVAGTIAKGSLPQYPYRNDSVGYAMSASVVSPLDKSTIDLKEAQRLYLVNCAICHGAKLDGNGPLYKDGEGPYSAAPKNLLGEDIKAMKEGTIFHSITYGKGVMGSYASQLSTKERWEVVHYIKSKQGPAVSGSGVAAKDSAAKAVK